MKFLSPNPSFAKKSLMGFASGRDHSGEDPIAFQILLIATWFGLVAAIGEGILALALPKLGWLSWRILRAVSPEIFWIIPVIDLLFFWTLAVVALGIRLLFHRLPWLTLMVFVS